MAGGELDAPVVGTGAEVAALVTPLPGWDTGTVGGEAEHYRGRVSAERESRARPDEVTADAARPGAPDLRMARVH